MCILGEKEGMGSKGRRRKGMGSKEEKVEKRRVLVLLG